MVACFAHGCVQAFLIMSMDALLHPPLFSVRLNHLIISLDHIASNSIAFKGVLANPINSNKYWRIVSDNFRKASSSTSAASRCSGRIAEAFKTLSSASSQKLRAKLVDGLRLCPLAKSQVAARREKLTTFALYLAMAFDTLSMGNYPYPSSYLTGDSSVKLPAFPIKHTCNIIEESNDSHLRAVVEGALGKSAHVYFDVLKSESLSTL